MTPKKDDDMIKHEIVNERLDSTTSTDSQQLTLLEKKHVLINREIDANGMGRYQWYMWSLCGFGYLLDLQWAQAFGLVLGPLSQELGISAHSSGNISVGTLAQSHQACINVSSDCLFGWSYCRDSFLGSHGRHHRQTLGIQPDLSD